MSEIPFIDDQYIDQTIKSAGVYNPALNKTQGVKLRELIKRLRDRIEESNSDVVNISGTQHITGTKSFTQISVEELSFIKNGFASLLRNPLNQSQNYIYTLPRESGEIALFSQLNKAVIDLENVDNTSDADKPISVATLQALRDKQNALNFSPENTSNKAVSLDNPDHTRYPTTQAVVDAINDIVLTPGPKGDTGASGATGAQGNQGVPGSDATVQDASAVSKGKLKLAGDLGGTADAPTVPGKANTSGDNATGTWKIDITGTAAVATNAMNWGGRSAELNNNAALVFAPVVIDGTDGKGKLGTVPLFQNWLGLNNGSVLNNAANSWGDATSQAQYSGDGTTAVNTFLMGFSYDSKWSPKSKTAVQTFIDVNNGATLFNNISGTSALSYNSAQWNGYDFDKSNAYGSGFDLIFGRTTGTNEARLISQEGMQAYIGVNPGGETLRSVLARGTQGNQGQSIQLQATDPGNGYYELKNVLNSEGTSFRLISGVWGISQDGFSIYNNRGTTPFFIAESGNTHIGYTSDLGYTFAVNGNSYFNGPIVGHSYAIDGWISNIAIARFGHRDFNTASYYGFLQSASGKVSIWGNGIDIDGNVNFSGNTRINGSLVSDGVFVGNSTGTFASNLEVYGRGVFLGGTGSDFESANLEVRSSSGRSPNLSFHWPGMVASQISIEPSGRIAIKNNPGTSYEAFIAETIYANGGISANGNVSGGRGSFGYDSGLQGSVCASNWFRSSGNTGWINESYGGGLYMSDSTWIRTYNNASIFSGTAIQAGQRFETSGHYKCFGFRGIAGDYDTAGTTDKIVWTIGDNWNTIESMYGIGYSYKTKYVDGNHQMVFRQAGAVHASIDLDDGRAFFDGMVTTPIVKATSKLLIPSTSGKQWSLYVQDN
ncbi:hypothetical protein AQ505_20395 [Pedobacter sp. PACM 27299]|uniref:shufflon system plasmid conjugative transfer pilus tip adhesin PilV n=1 Tax=Pedobacter sp. PACM 27299 TaxID=1727164 RepID=UPI0007061B40|nr:shufflon system plasmid conjugative transfer pilus tip adhesin PilV [Pedobacter sp. PACM 27299]ALL07640.1 hypothetical protein AQ505_20395 [Pedobacter sp. PACM 27299]